MDPSDAFAVVLYSLLGLLLGCGLGRFVIGRRPWRAHRAARREEPEQEVQARQWSRFTFVPFHPIPACRPSRWLAIRSRDMHAVQLALGLHQPRPCSCTEGLFTSQRLFIAPPVNGWTLVFGADLPVPDDDVDGCFRFLRELSRKLGHVQFFQADQLLQHHAWVQVQSGRVLRAYAWAGAVIWNQGLKTGAEIELGMNCFNYGEHPGRDDWALADHLVANVARVAQLARRWSLDPAEMDGRLLAQQQGITGHGAGNF